MSEYYYCEDCKEFFREDEMVCETSVTHSDYIGHGGWMEEYTNKCPHCYSEEIEEAEVCQICGEPTINENGFCDDCLDYFRTEFKEFVEKIRKEKAAEERDVADIIFAIIDEDY